MSSNGPPRSYYGALKKMNLKTCAKGTKLRVYISLLDERRLRAADHVQAYQRKMTRAFRKRVKPRKFQKGDLVLKVLRGLISDPRGKFRQTWSEPYVIRDLTREGAVWLMDLDENQFTELVNVDQLKKFYA